MASPPFLVPVFLEDKWQTRLVVTVDKPSTLDRSAYPSNWGKKQRSVLLFSIVAAVSTGAQQAGMFRSCVSQVTHCQLPTLDFRISPRAPFVSDRTRHQ